MTKINDLIEQRIKGASSEIPTPACLGLEYESFVEVATEARDLFIADLAVHTTHLPKSYAEVLRPCPSGIYTVGSVEPMVLFTDNTAYYTATQYEKMRKEKKTLVMPDVRNFNDFISSREPVVDAAGKIIARSPILNKRMFRADCAFNYSAIHLAAIGIYDIFAHLNANTTPRTNLQQAQLSQKNYLVDGYEEWFKPDEIPGLESIVNDLYKFIARDIHAVYRVCLKNTTIHVEKGNDYRVIEYYRQIFEAFEERVAQDFF